MADKTEIRKLVEAFRKNLRHLKEADVPEADIRQEYIDRFWELLGWDVRNRDHRSPAEKDVVIERSFSTSEDSKLRIKRPDYIFKIDGGFSRFIAEAKKLSVDVDSHKDSIFQAKSYAWSSQIPFAILTNFEQFRLFDATIKPYNAEPRKGVVADFDLRFEDYESQWDILESTFGREAVAAGSLENLLAKIKNVRAGRKVRGIDRMLIDLRGSEPVDKAFLKHLEEYRLRFARAIYAENRKMFPDADTHHGSAKLTEVTQRLIDRLVFIRVCEDRGVTSYGELRDIVNVSSKDGRDLYESLCTKFRSLDDQYNGNLFKAHVSEQIQIPADLLADFIRSLYQPEGPYRFDAIGDDILGIIYERFLGSTITVDKRNQVDAEEKPEVRHAGGVYYTPKFVVDTIVRRVIGPKIEGKSPSDILNITILDPACGSGSFLIAALQYLYDYCAHYLTTHPKEDIISFIDSENKKRKVKVGLKDSDGIWHVSPDFRALLLKSCIYGVDIDMQAVEVTIMSLYLKLLEGKLWQREFLRQKLLPSLDHNIHCGNSLIAQADFDRYWEGKHNTLFGFDDDTRFRINAFDWTSQTRGFGNIFDAKKGFDCIIGNPPYIRVQELNEWAPEECEFYKTKYHSAAKGNYDIYVVFIEKGLQLLNPDGLMGYICPHKFWQAKYGQGIREIISKEKHLKSVIDFTDQQVFKGATTYTAIHIFAKNGAHSKIGVSRISELTDGDSQCLDIDKNVKVVGASVFESDCLPANDIWSFVDSATRDWHSDIQSNNPRLGDIATVFVGVQTSADKIYHLDIVSQENHTCSVRSRLDNSVYKIESDLMHVLLSGEDVREFSLNAPRQMILFPYYWESSNQGQLIPEKVIKTDFPLAWFYLKKHESSLRARENGRFDNSLWYQFGRSQNIGRQRGIKLCVPRLAEKLRCAFDSTGASCLDNVDVNGINIRPEYDKTVSPLLLLAILNSTLADNFIRAHGGTHFRGGFSSFNRQFIEDLPIKIPNSKPEKEIAKKISDHVSLIIDAKKDLATPGLSENQINRLERQIEAHEKQIDELVLKLYGVDSLPS